MQNHISEKAVLGKNVKVGLYSIIEDDVIIGDDVIIENFCSIGKGSKIKNNCHIGTHTIVRNHVEIGQGCKFTAYCEIRDNVVVGDFTTFGSRCTISANAVIGANVSIKYGFVLTDTPDLKDSSKKIVGNIGDYTMIGANVCLMPGFSIGKNCIIGANSQVRNDIGNKEVWYGNPATFYKNNT